MENAALTFIGAFIGSFASVYIVLDIIIPTQEKIEAYYHSRKMKKWKQLYGEYWRKNIWQNALIAASFGNKKKCP